MKADSKPVLALQALTHSFGERPARRKLRLLEQLATQQHLNARSLIALQDTLNFLRAYPDDARVRRAVLTLIGSLRKRVTQLSGRRAQDHLENSGLPGAVHAYSYHYGVLQEMVAAFPGCLDIDWDALEDESALCDALGLALPPAEVDGLEDERLSLQEWFALCRPPDGTTDLEVALAQLARSPHAPSVLTHLYDGGDIPVRYALRAPGTGRCEVTIPTQRVCYQRHDLKRERFDLRPHILRPLHVGAPLSLRQGRALVRSAHATLCTRNLEIYPLIHANPADTHRFACGRGVEVVFVGTKPEFRAALESLYFYLITKNGVPIAYGPAGVFLGACEMGINLFPEFRGGEVRFIYAQLMRVLRHLLGVEYYYLLRYGMGEHNPDAIRSGAFWFYRKLGFRAQSPRVESLARQEEVRMRRQPGYRSDRAMLKRLSHTEVYFDMSQGQRAPFDFAALGVALSRFVARRYGGDRARAARDCRRRIAQALGVSQLDSYTEGELAAFGALAPILAMIPRLESWPRQDKTLLSRAVRAKGRASEAAAARALSRHRRLGEQLRAIATETKTEYPS